MKVQVYPLVKYKFVTYDVCIVCIKSLLKKHCLYLVIFIRRYNIRLACMKYNAYYYAIKIFSDDLVRTA